MGEKDIIEKQLEDYNEVFADIVNGLLFGGEQVVEESQLDDMTEIRHVDEVLKLISVISGDNQYYEVSVQKKRRVKNMCEVTDRLVNKGIEKGMQVFLNCISRGMSREDAQTIADISDCLVQKALRSKNTGDNK